MKTGVARHRPKPASHCQDKTGVANLKTGVANPKDHGVSIKSRLHLAIPLSTEAGATDQNRDRTAARRG